MKNRNIRLAFLKSTSGQNFVEYALMAAFVAATAGALVPGISSSVSAIFAQADSTLSSAASEGVPSTQLHSEGAASAGQ